MTITFGADAQLRFERERAAVQVDQVLGDRQPEAGALFGRFDRVRALAERGQSTIGISSSGMPGPVSLTLMYWPPDAVQPTFSQISPPCGVNLMAFDSRLRQICRTARSSAHSRGMSGSNTSWMVMPRLPARSLSRWWQSSTT